MSKFLLLLYFFIISTTVFFSCKTDFEINADYKDITLVYGLLNQKEDTHYIKINKAFLGNKNAYEMAKVSDSINYSNAKVYVDQWKGNAKVSSIPFNKVKTNKLSGIFANDNNYVYKGVGTLDPNAADSLHIFLGSKHVFSKTSLISDFSIESPNTFVGPTAPTISFQGPTFKAKWKSAKNGKIYEITVRFHYYEISNSGSTIKHDSIDWVLPVILSSGIAGSEQLIQEFTCDNFYNLIGTKLKPIAGVTRVAKKKAVDFIFSVGGDDLNTYIEVSRPSEGLVQDKPAFTNIANGLGIFSCRYKKEIIGKIFNENTIDSLSSGIHTKNLGFLNFANTGVWWNNNHNLD